MTQSNKNKMKYLLVLFGLSIFLLDGSAQISGSNDAPSNSYKYDQKLLNHYSIAELENIRNNYPEDFNIITYYHLSSYQLIITDSLNPVLELFDIENFDIAKYDKLRKLDEDLEIDFDKYGVKLVLTAYNNLMYLTHLQVINKENLENQ